ncbi:kinase-like protein [Lojkania enalia]|uniref:Kinase-like protein n=1 Tax=Lojkania enalia TaxID=147567 RepID=A0A9P4K0A6_9PLEO|nr:kinase-like protein [Didymosphaeria enalia]
MASLLPLTSEEGLQAYLTAQKIDYISTTLLIGGITNFVYRVTFPSNKTKIYKHAAPYSHSNTDLALDPKRMDFEARSLELLSPLLSKNLPEVNVHTVKLYSYRKPENLICMEDGGERNLKSAYPDPDLDITAIGTELGQWIAGLHLCSKKVSLSPSNPQDLEANNFFAVNICQYSYYNLPHALSQFGHDPKFGDFINMEFGSMLSSENECICHGDFWPGNILVKQKDGDVETQDLTVVDWEMVRRGNSATDTGQFAAESFLLDRFCGGRGLLPAFLNAYAEARMKATSSGSERITREWMKRMVIHWGVHIAFWPTRVEWTDQNGTQDLVDIGVSVMKAAAEEDWERLGTSPVFAGVDNVWETLWMQI